MNEISLRVHSVPNSPFSRTATWSKSRQSDAKVWSASLRCGTAGLARVLSGRRILLDADRAEGHAQGQLSFDAGIRRDDARRRLPDGLPPLPAGCRRPASSRIAPARSRSPIEKCWKRRPANATASRPNCSVRQRRVAQILSAAHECRSVTDQSHFTARIEI